MPLWLKWWLGLFVGINALAVVASVPNPFSIFYTLACGPAPAARTLDGGIRGLGLAMAIGMLIGWAVLAAILAAALRKGQPVRPEQ